MKIRISLLISLCMIACSLSLTLAAESEIRRYVRFEVDGIIAHGVLENDKITVLSGGIFPMSRPTARLLDHDEIVLLPPTHPGKVFAVGMNFASHIASSADGAPPLFLKLPSSLVGSGRDIVLPQDAQNVHFEGELVLVIGKQAKNISADKAKEFIFGVTAGNDLTERSWQSGDLQWLRAKATDGFGPVGPALVTGLDYENLLLTTRLNGEIVQQENTRNMIHSPTKVVSYLSRYFTLEPGDMIFMGTPGRTKALQSGDIVSVEIDSVGRLTNKIKR